MVREAVLAFNGDVQVEAFSSLKKQGVDKLRQKLDSWFSELAPVEEIQDGNNHPLCRMAPLRVLSGLRCERNFSYAQKRPSHKLTGAAKIFSQIRLREVKGLKDRTSYLCTLRE